MTEEKTVFGLCHLLLGFRAPLEHPLDQEDNDYDVVLHVAEAVPCMTVITLPGN